MEKDDKESTMIWMGVSGWMFLLVPAYPGCPGSKAVKRSLLFKLLTVYLYFVVFYLAAFKRHYALRLAIAPEFFYCSYMCLFYVCALSCWNKICICMYVVWVALPASVPSTHHFHHPLPLHSSTPGFKISFSANPSHRSLRSSPVLLPEWLHWFPGRFTNTHEHVRFTV